MINNSPWPMCCLLCGTAAFTSTPSQPSALQPAEAAEALILDAEVLLALIIIWWAMECCAWWGLSIQMELTEYGSRLSNVVSARHTEYQLGGYGSQVANIGPLLRKEVTRDEWNNSIPASFQSGNGSTDERPAGSGCAQDSCGTQPSSHAASGLRRRWIPDSGSPLRSVVSRNRHRQIGRGIAGAEENIRRYGLESRLRVIQAEIGVDPFPLDERRAANRCRRFHLPAARDRPLWQAANRRPAARDQASFSRQALPLFRNDAARNA